MKYLNKVIHGKCQRCALGYTERLMRKVLGHKICIYCFKDLSKQINKMNLDLNQQITHPYKIRYIHIEDTTE